MELKLIAIDDKLPSWLEMGINQYQKRIPKNIHFQLITSGAIKRTKTNSIEIIKNKESDKLLSLSKQSTKIIALDERGKSHTTKDFAEKIKHWQQNDEKVSFLIGGTDGHNQQLKQTANELWAISPFTLTHGMARLLMVEQIYRSISLLNNHPYHRE
jgi:23S rRNA (pseudouridine1915-N3)-methyltransferase